MKRGGFALRVWFLFQFSHVFQVVWRHDEPVGNVNMKFEALITISFVLLNAVGGQSCSWNEYDHEGRCCQTCPPGTAVKIHCSEKGKTVCRPCEDGTFAAERNSKTECVPCNKNIICSSGMKLTQVCNKSADNKCGCPQDNKYHDVDTDWCMNCVVCTAGYYPEKPCSKSTMCRTCPEGHFSNRTDNYKHKCVTCTKCSRYARKCDGTHDAICDDDVSVPEVLPTTVGVDTDPDHSGTENHSDNNSGSNIIGTKFIVVIVLVVFILVVLFFVLILKKKRKFRFKRSNFKIEESRYEVLRTAGVLLRDQPSSLFFGLQKRLNPEEPNANWKTLAIELGFSYMDIANFEVDRRWSAERMLASWQTKSCATVDKLHECLIKIDRHDVAKFLADSVVKEEESVV